MLTAIETLILIWYLKVAHVFLYRVRRGRASTHITLIGPAGGARRDCAHAHCSVGNRAPVPH